MLFFKLRGYKEVPVGVDELLVRCPCCEAHSWADVMVVSKYFHLYFAPMWPVAKEANVICHRCGLKRYGILFTEKLVDNFEEVKQRFKHPWFSYLGLMFIVVFVIVILIAQVIHFG
jgi:hypothetical protein